MCLEVCVNNPLDSIDYSIRLSIVYVYQDSIYRFVNLERLLKINTLLVNSIQLLK